MGKDIAEKCQHVEDILYGTLNELYERVKDYTNKPEQLNILVNSIVKLTDCISRFNRRV